MSTYPSLEAYTADIVTAREAYAEDQAVADGLCAVCKQRRHDKCKRMCGPCRHLPKEQR